MGFIIYNLYNDKKYEVENSILQVNNLQNEEIKEKETKNEVLPNIGEQNEFTEEEIKNVLQTCLDLESSKSNGPVNSLYILGLYKENDRNLYYESEVAAQKTGFIRTSIKYTDFVNSMLKYMTEECYREQWAEFFEDEDGYLCYANVGQTGVHYEVNTIEKVEDYYIASVTEFSEESESQITVNFKLSDNKCIVESYNFY